MHRFYQTLIFAFTFIALPELTARIWTNQEGQTLKAEYLELKDDTVKVRRLSDRYILFLQLETLSKEDRVFVQEQVTKELARKQPKPPQNNPTIPHDPFAFGGTQLTAEQRSHPGQPKATTETVPTEGLDRGLIPSLAQEEISKGYPNGPSCLINFMVWWNESSFPGLLPSADRENAIERIDSQLETYCKTSSNGNTIDGLSNGIRHYSEKKLKGYEIKVIKSPKGPTIDDLELGCEGWNGTVLLVGFYKKSGSTWKRNGGRFASLISANDQRIVFNRNGSQYTGTVKPFPLETIEKEQRHYLKAWRATGILEFSEISAAGAGFIPEGYCALIDSAFIMTPYKVQPSK